MITVLPSEGGYAWNWDSEGTEIMITVWVNEVMHEIGIQRALKSWLQYYFRNEWGYAWILDREGTEIMVTVFLSEWGYEPMYELQAWPCYANVLCSTHKLYIILFSWSTSMISVQVCIFITCRCVPLIETYVCHCDILIHLCISMRCISWYRCTPF